MQSYNQFNKMNSTQKFGCKTCGSNKHAFKECPDNICRKCKRKGHIAVDCYRRWTNDDTNDQYQDNIHVKCGCSYNSVIMKRKEFEQKGGIPHDTHCCECNRPYPIRLLESWENKYVCKPGCGGRSRMIQLNNNNKRKITPPQSPILVKKALPIEQWDERNSA